MIDSLATIFLQEGAAPQGGGGIVGLLINILPFFLVIVVFYFLLIRPQNKKRKALQAKIDGLQKGDRFVTAGGLYCTVVGIKENKITAKAGDAKIEIHKNFVTAVLGPEADDSEVENSNM